MKKKKSFLIQTAKDYDMLYCNVESIYNKYQNNMTSFYNELEYYIKCRRLK